VARRSGKKNLLRYKLNEASCKVIWAMACPRSNNIHTTWMAENGKSRYMHKKKTKFFERLANRSIHNSVAVTAAKTQNPYTDTHLGANAILTLPSVFTRPCFRTPKCRLHFSCFTAEQGTPIIHKLSSMVCLCVCQWMCVCVWRSPSVGWPYLRPLQPLPPLRFGSGQNIYKIPPSKNKNYQQTQTSRITTKGSKLL